MKKLFFLTVMLLISILANAQLRIDSLGNAIFGIDNTPTNAKVYIKNDSLSVGLSYKTDYKNAFVGIASCVYTRSTSGSYGIRGYVSARKSCPYIVGVEGYTSYEYPATGSLLGVVGRMGAMTDRRRGAGIYGTNSFSINVNAIDTTYAGFFYGRTKVVGNLTVTGQVRGTLLYASPTSDSRGHSSYSFLDDKKLSDRLMPLKTLLYTYEMPESLALSKAASDDNNTRSISLDFADTESCSDVGDEQEEISDIERQIIYKQHYGLSAEQLEEVFPDLVYEQEDGTKSINYVEMVPILVQAINELKGEIEELRTGGDDRTKKAVQSSSEGDSAEKLLWLSLGQNKPNPFSNSTTIEVCIPEDVQKAFIYVYDLQGKKVDQVDITARGKQNVQLTSGNLTDGMYLYSLIADGKVVETRRMIVEK